MRLKNAERLCILLLFQYLRDMPAGATSPMFHELVQQSVRRKIHKQVEMIGHDHKCHERAAASF